MLFITRDRQRHAGGAVVSRWERPIALSLCQSSIYQWVSWADCSWP